MLLDDIKKRMFAAMKAGATIEKEALRVAVGEITTVAARSSEEFGDDEVRVVLKKLVKSTEETLGLTEDTARRAALEEELAVLRSFLPATLGADEIALLLAPVADAIRAAKSDGQATGIAMKHLKSAGTQADGKNVAAVVTQLRR